MPFAYIIHDLKPLRFITRSKTTADQKFHYLFFLFNLHFIILIIY